MELKVIRWTQEEIVGVRNCFRVEFKGIKGRKEASKGREKEASKGREERSFQGKRGRKLPRKGRKEAS